MKIFATFLLFFGFTHTMSAQSLNPETACERQLVILVQELTEYPDELLQEASDESSYRPGKRIDTMTYMIGNVAIRKFTKKKKLGAKYQVEIEPLGWKWNQNPSGAKWSRFTTDNDQRCDKALVLLQFVAEYLHYKQSEPDLIHPAFAIASLADSTLERLAIKKVPSTLENGKIEMLYYLKDVLVIKGEDGVRVAVEANPVGTPLFFIFSSKSYTWTWYATETEAWKWSSRNAEGMASALVWGRMQALLLEAIYLKK